MRGVASQTRLPYYSLKEEVGIGRLGLPMVRARSVKPQRSPDSGPSETGIGPPRPMVADRKSVV